MELINTEYEVLSRDEQGDVLIKYTLDSTPSRNWARYFNKRQRILDAKATYTNPFIFVRVDPTTLSEKDIGSFLDQFIELINTELQKESAKHDIITTYFVPGMIVVHDNFEESDYESYIQDIVSRLQLSNYE